MKKIENASFLDLLKKEKLLPTNIVAQRLKLSRSTVYRLILMGKLKAIRLSERNVMVIESSINEYLRKINKGFI